MVKSLGYYIKMNMAIKQKRNGKMNNKLKEVMVARYQAEIADAKYKIQCYSDQELIIPEHPDITAEVDKLLSAMAEAEDKMAVMELHYDKNVADKNVL